MVTDRPDATESALTVPVRTVQIEAGFVLGRESLTVGGMSGRVEFLDVATTLLRYGLTRSVELRLGSAFRVETVRHEAGITRVHGVNGLSFGTKIQLRRDAGVVPQAAVILSLAVPAGHDDLVSEHVEPGLVLAMAHVFSDFWGFSYNLGGYWGEAGRFNLLYTGSLGMSFTERLGGYVEVFGGSERRVFFDGGVTYLLAASLQLDSSAGFALTEGHLDRFVNVGLSVRLPY